MSLTRKEAFVAARRASVYPAGFGWGWTRDARINRLTANETAPVVEFFLKHPNRLVDG